MVNKCCVPNCKSGYRSSVGKFATFKFPKDQELRNTWIRSIPRDFNISKHTVVCELHFEKHLINKHGYEIPDLPVS